jgi:hypothetical protein
MTGNSQALAQRAAVEAKVLKAATRQLIERLGGLEAAVAVLRTDGGRRVRRSQISNYQNQHSQQFLPPDLIARLERAAGAQLVTAELARIHGFALVRPDPGAGQCVVRELAELAAESADVARAFAAGLAHGRLCPEDLVRIQRETLELHAQSEDVLSAVAAQLASASQPMAAAS